MQPSRKREGKPAGEGAGDTVGMQPPPRGGGKSGAKAEGKPVGEGGGRRENQAKGDTVKLSSLCPLAPWRQKTRKSSYRNHGRDGRRQAAEVRY